MLICQLKPVRVVSRIHCCGLQVRNSDVIFFCCGYQTDLSVNYYIIVTFLKLILKLFASIVMKPLT